MDFSNVIPRDCHPALRWLGKLDPWLDYQRLDGKRTALTVDWSKIRAAPGYDAHARYLERVLGSGPQLTRQDPLVLAWIDALAACLATGPKMFIPTAEQFDSMQHVELRVPISDYRQPYPALVVQIPEESRRALAARVGERLDNAPRWALLHTGVSKAGHRHVLVGHAFTSEGKHNTHLFQERPEFATVEDALLSRIMKEGDTSTSYDFVEASGRACLNLMLMLTHYGWRDGPPLHPADHAKHRRKQNLERFRHADFTTVEMKQHVIVRREVKAPAEPGQPTGHEVAPHWRRGHWRRWPGYRSVLLAGGTPKMMFINPQLIRADRAVGDLAETEASYAVR